MDSIKACRSDFCILNFSCANESIDNNIIDSATNNRLALNLLVVTIKIKTVSELAPLNDNSLVRKDVGGCVSDEGNFENIIHVVIIFQNEFNLECLEGVNSSECLSGSISECGSGRINELFGGNTEEFFCQWLLFLVSPALIVLGFRKLDFEHSFSNCDGV